MPKHEWEEAVSLCDVGIEHCEWQLSQLLYFLFEHPLASKIWQFLRMKRLAAKPGVYEVTFHQCAFGQLTTDASNKTGLVYKPTRVITNMAPATVILDKKCSREHDHVQLLSGRAANAAIYPPDMCKAILECLKKCDQPSQTFFSDMTFWSEKDLPELARAVRHHDLWPEDLPLAMYRSPETTTDRTDEFCVSPSDTLFGGITVKVNLGDGTSLQIVEPGIFFDYVDEHAWFEGDEEMTGSSFLEICQG